MGFDKILEKLGRLRELEVVLLDGMRIVRGDGAAEVLNTCPSEFGYSGDKGGVRTNNWGQRLRNWMFPVIFGRVWKRLRVFVGG